MTIVSRRRFVQTTLAASTALAPRRSRAQTSVKVGTAVLGDYALAGPFVIALEKGYFSQEGLAAEFVPFRGGPDLVRAVIAGDILLGATGGTDILVFREAGMPIRMVATGIEGNHFTLNVALSVRQAADLRGQAIGVTLVGCTTWVFARLFARQQGWDPDRDVKIVALGPLDAQLAALQRKETQAFVWGDGGAVSAQQGRSRVLTRLDSVTPRWISLIEYASEESIKKRAEAIRRAMRAVYRAQRFMRTNTAEAAEIAAKKLGWSVEATLGAHRISGPLLSEDGTISTEALKAMQDVLLEHGAIKKRLPLEDHFVKDFTPVKV